MSNSMNANEDGSVTCYMDGTDWECEIGAALGGSRLYPSAEDCAENIKKHLCCGIAEVEVRFVRWIREPDYSELLDDSLTEEEQGPADMEDH